MRATRASAPAKSGSSLTAVAAGPTCSAIGSSSGNTSRHQQISRATGRSRTLCRRSPLEVHRDPAAQHLKLSSRLEQLVGTRDPPGAEIGRQPTERTARRTDDGRAMRQHQDVGQCALRLGQRRIAGNDLRSGLDGRESPPEPPQVIVVSDSTRTACGHRLTDARSHIGRMASVCTSRAGSDRQSPVRCPLLDVDRREVPRRQFARTPRVARGLRAPADP